MTLHIFYSRILPAALFVIPNFNKNNFNCIFTELEVHDIVSVNISSIEDKWALHILNLHTVVQGFLFGIPVAREIPIFGDPFGTGDLLFGIIDELRFDEANYTLCLVELKTRKSTTLPGKTQQKQHAFQVGQNNIIYK